MTVDRQVAAKGGTQGSAVDMRPMIVVAEAAASSCGGATVFQPVGSRDDMSAGDQTSRGDETDAVAMRWRACGWLPGSIPGAPRQKEGAAMSWIDRFKDMSTWAPKGAPELPEDEESDDE